MAKNPNFAETISRSLVERSSELKAVPKAVPQKTGPAEKNVLQPIPQAEERKFKINDPEEETPTQLLDSGVRIEGKRKSSKKIKTINFDEDLIEKIETLAKEQHISCSAVINQILRQVM